MLQARGSLLLAQSQLHGGRGILADARFIEVVVSHLPQFGQDLPFHGTGSPRWSAPQSTNQIGGGSCPPFGISP
jgi:hypothetical protein